MALWLVLPGLTRASEGVPSRLRFTVKVAPKYEALFTRKRGWTGADGSYSVPLSAQTTLWLYGDTWVGEIRDGKHTNATMVNNSVAIQRGNDPAAASVEFFYGKGPEGKPAALISPLEGRGFFWLLSGVRTAKGLFLFAMQVEKIEGNNTPFGFRQLAMWLIHVANPDARPTQWQTVQRKIPWSRFSRRRNTLFGAALLKHDRFVYIFGIDEDTVDRFHVKHMVVARVPEADLADLDGWRLFADGSWQSDFKRGSRLFAHAANECSVSYQPALEKFVVIYSKDGLSEEIQMRLAPSPQGPWGDPITIYTCPEVKWHQSVFCYAGKGHASLGTADDELIVTYVANSLDFWHMAADARLYRPRFLRLKFER